MSEKKETTKPLDPLLAHLAEVMEQSLALNSQELSVLQSIAAALGVTPTPTAVSPMKVIPLPEGTIRAVEDITTTGTFEPVVSYTPTQGKTFHLTKIVASCNSAYEVQLYWKGKPITVIYKQVGGNVLTDWFPAGYTDITLAPMVGDGVSQIQLMGRFPSGGSADDLWGEIVGEEV
jgi:hypothetical protein